MIEKIVTSKTRVKILNLFLTHIDDRYYLRELERVLNESLSPLRRQLVKLEKMGILTIEEEANLKYYRLNKNFAGMEDLRRLVLGSEAVAVSKVEHLTPETVVQGLALDKTAPAPKRVKYDLAVLTLVSIFVLITAVFVVYTGTKNIKQVANLVSAERSAEIGSRIVKTKEPVSPASLKSPDEMISRRWKVQSGGFPVLSSGETGLDLDKEKTSKEL